MGSGRLGISEEAVKAQIEKRIPVKFLEANMEAFKMGIELSK